jgi:hypothetical protein
MIAFLKATAVIIATREAMVWGPKILKWSTTNVSLEEEPALPPSSKADSATAGK